ncbi:zinc metalloprotease [Pseudoalteromonas aurantia]|uniref:Peptidase M43 pregnancy-associated plasma-A domain-containing protein n=1 Tax=Pseudoalteromonas aurantia 208 TaxID=1314867 RepID=A0ABR9EA20_9GAMM|nr:M43 family zinc metalloprotease [Pseudoalteromonas aurantia]MBE0367827.1 hypothetical protein [Pseudoalteromonas aurantia 208]
MTQLHFSLASLALASLLGGCSGSSENTVTSASPENKGISKQLPQTDSSLASKSTISLKYNPLALNSTPSSLMLTKDQNGSFAIKVMAGFKVEQVSGCNAKLSAQKNAITLNGTNQDCTITILDKKIVNKVAITSTVTGLGELIGLPESIATGSAFTFNSQARSGHHIGSLSGCGVTRTNKNAWIVKNAIAPCHITAKFESQFQAPDALLEVIKLPIVVHALDSATTVITDSQIRAQLVQLNRNFRAQSASQAISTFGAKKLSHGMKDSGIQFYLASKTPSGEVTSGINRVAHSTTIEPFSSNKPVWDTSRYVNVWVGDLDTETGFKLSKTIKTQAGSDKKTGIIIDSSVFNTQKAKPEKHSPTIEQKTPLHAAPKTVLTHEVGHFLGLHGFVVDSPIAPPCDMPTSFRDTCANEQLYFNFMRESASDEHRKTFTQSQIQRMRDTLTQGNLKSLYDNSLAL